LGSPIAPRAPGRVLSDAILGDQHSRHVDLSVSSHRIGRKHPSKPMQLTKSVRYHEFTSCMWLLLLLPVLGSRSLVWLVLKLRT